MARLTGLTARILEGSLSELRETIAKQLVHVKRQQALLDKAESCLEKFDSALSTETMETTTSDELLFSTTETMIVYERYFNQDAIHEIHELEHRDEQGRKSTMEENWNEWCNLLQRLIAHGFQPEDKRAQDLMEHWRQMLQHMTDNDTGKLKAFNELFHSEPQARGDHGIAEKMFAFMGRVIFTL